MSTTATNAPETLAKDPQLDETKRLAPADLAEATASLRVLVCLAKADGELSAQDKRLLHDTLHCVLHPSAQTLGYLADEKIDLEAELHKIKSGEMRERTYNAAYCLAHMDGVCSMAKAAVLDKIRAGLKISDERATVLGRVYAEARETLWPDHINPLPDPAIRNAKIHDEIVKYSILNAVSGSISVAGSCRDRSAGHFGANQTRSRHRAVLGAQSRSRGGPFTDRRHCRGHRVAHRSTFHAQFCSSIGKRCGRHVCIRDHVGARKNRKSVL